MEMEAAAAAYIYIHLATNKARKKKSKRRWWETKLFEKRIDHGGDTLLSDLKFQEISGQYKNFTRMSPVDFEFLLQLIGGKIAKRDTHLRKAISAQDRLAVTLRFLATGDSFTSLKYLFRISEQTIGQIVPEVCQALCDVLDNIKIPASSEGWMNIANEYDSKWNFPHCIGALDGKHVVIDCPTGSGSVFYNFKGFFSVVLFALVDADYNYTFVDVGTQGSVGDSTVFENSALGKRLSEGSLDIPKPEPLAGMETDIPYFVVGDEAFALSKFLMRVYAGHFPKGTRQRLFNYRLCRARRVVENVFGITASVFRILRKPMCLLPDKVSLIVLTITKLHNFLRQRKQSSERYTPPGTFDHEIEGEEVPGTWRNDSSAMSSLLPLKKVARRAPLSAVQVRDKLSLYFASSHGRVTWQNKKA